MEINSTLIECHDAANRSRVLFNFLILDAPTPSNLPSYIKELQRRRVSHLVRVCGPTYDAALVQQNGIEVHSWPFGDGAPPTKKIIDNWLQLLDAEKAKLEKGQIDAPATIGVHCVAGLGRAPILVALALVQYENVAPLDAVTEVRTKRSGAINQVQMQWLMHYTRRKDGGACSMM